MKRNILSEIDDPQEERRVIQVNNPNHFQRNTTNKTIKLVHQAKQYGLVFDKLKLVILLATVPGRRSMTIM